MCRLIMSLVSALLSGLRARRDLVLENLALRQQLATVLQKHQPRIRPTDRMFWVLLRRFWSKWADAVIIVKPKSVVAWHRAGFSLYWKWLSRSGRPAGRPSINRQIREPVDRMATENGWRATRIHGELLKLGFQVSERTVSRYLRQHRRRPEHRQSWRTFLRNHREVVFAMDFFVVPTATFRLLYVWFAIGHARRQVLHWSVTEFPSATWVIQQLRQTFSFDEIPLCSRYLLFDRDPVFSAEVIRVATSMALTPKRTSYQSPWQNGVAERLVGSVRRELLDHVIVLHEQHLRRLLSEYWAYYHGDRTHLGVGKDSPMTRAVEHRPLEAAVVRARRRVGGLHHRRLGPSSALSRGTTRRSLSPTVLRLDARRN